MIPPFEESGVYCFSNVSQSIHHSKTGLIDNWNTVLELGRTVVHYKNMTPIDLKVIQSQTKVTVTFWFIT
mgnify:FL=1